MAVQESSQLTENSRSNLWTQGPYTDVEHLVGLRILASDLKLSKQRKVLSSMVGGHQSKMRGRGIDFSEVRLYQPGDDIRTIDWKVTAKTSKPHTKIFSEEKERPVFLFVDQRASSFFGSVRCFKSVLSAEIASLLAWTTLHSGDKIGGLIFSDQDEREIRPKQNRKQLLQFIHEVNKFNHQLTEPFREELNQGSASRFESMLQHMRQVIRPGSAIYLISDFYGYDESQKGILSQLSRHNDITAIQVFDPLEAALPKLGMYTFSNGNDHIEIDAMVESQKHQYSQQFHHRQQQLEYSLNSVGIPLLSIATNDDPLTALSKGLGLKK